MIDRKTGKAVPGYLRNLKLAELSGCGRGANQYARVVLVKSADGSAMVKKFASLNDLPAAIKALPAEAQTLFMTTANQQLEKNVDESEAFKVAWTAVKARVTKVDGVWTLKAGAPSGGGGGGGGGGWDDADKVTGGVGDDDPNENADGTKKPDKGKKKYPWMTAGKIDALAKAFYGYPSAVSDESDDGAQSFDDLIEEREEQRARYEVSENIWPLFSALQDSVNSILADDAVASDAKLPLIRQSVEQFMVAVGDAVPDAVAELEKLLKSDPAKFSGVFDAGDQSGDHTVPAAKEFDMADDTKKVAELETQIATLTKSLETATATIAELTTAKTTAETQAADLKKSIDLAKTDEVIVIDNPADPTKKMGVHKSAVGDQTFAFMKSQQARIDKAEAERFEVVFAKRAESEIGNLPGDSLMKGRVLKAIEDIADKDVREAAVAALKAGNTAMKSAFKPLGKDGSKDGSGDPTDQLEAMAKELAKEQKVSFSKAYEMVLNTDEGKQLYRDSLRAA